MASEEDRLRHSTRRKRNILTKIDNDFKGPFKIKPVDPRRGEYKREKISTKEVELKEDEYYEDEF